MALSIEPHEVEGVPVLAVAGELDIGTAPRLVTQIDRACTKRLLVDLSALEFCDSTGLRALFGAAQEARVRRARLRIVAPANAGAARVFELAGASEFLPLVESPTEGLAQLATVVRS
jgi:anti-sigma B factor antagonist